MKWLYFPRLPGFELLRAAAKTASGVNDLFFRNIVDRPVLIHHKVGPPSRRQIAVTVKDFEAEINWIVRDQDAVELETAIQRWRNLILASSSFPRSTMNIATPSRLHSRG